MKQFEESGPLCIGCDRCGRFLGTDGKPYPTESPEIASFRRDGNVPAATVAQEAASEAGWTFEVSCPEEGDDSLYVRCSECVGTWPRASWEPEWMREFRTKHGFPA